MKDDYTLSDLLRGHKPALLAQALASMLGAYRLVACDGTVVSEHGQPTERWQRHTLVFGVEDLGWLECAHNDAAQTACQWLQMLMWSGARYLMACTTHEATVQADYEALLDKHERLLASESALRELATSLDERVRAQVLTIDAAQRQLYQTSKLAAVGQLAAGMAHEINNPIGFIRSNLSAARGYVTQLTTYAGAVASTAHGQSLNSQHDISVLLEDFHELVNESLSGADRIASIVANLKNFAAIDQAEASLADVNEHVQAVAKLMTSKLARGQELQLELGAVPLVQLSSARFNEALFNILMNAIQALGAQAGRITVRTESVDGTLYLRVRDTGCGMPAELLTRAFDPFYTTRDVGAGSGLGLTVARDIVIAHGGTISLHSERGAGCEVVIAIPIAGAVR